MLNKHKLTNPATREGRDVSSFPGPEESTMKSIIVISTYGPCVSFSRVIKQIIKKMKKKFPVYLMALDQEGKPWCDEHLNIIPCSCNGYEPIKARYIFDLMQIIKPCLVLVSYDVFPLPHYYKYLFAIRQMGAKVVVHLPVDGDLVNIKPLLPLLRLDQLLFYTKYIKKRFVELYWELKKTQPDLPELPRLSVSPLGTDVTSFYPINGSIDAHFTGKQRYEAKKKAFPHRPELHDSFIVLNANRNWERKRLDLTIEGFARFARGKPSNVYLYLHLPRVNTKEKEKLLSLARRCQIASRVVIPQEENYSVSIEQLNLIYNACEVGINTAMGEGWGLVSCEHAATGAAQILPNHTCFPEVWEDAGVYTQVVSTERIWHCPHLEFKVTTPQSVAEKLNNLYQDKYYLKQMSKAAYQRMRQPYLQWEQLQKNWKLLFDELLANQKSNQEARYNTQLQ